MRKTMVSLIVLGAITFLGIYYAYGGTLEFDGVPVDVTTTAGEDLLIVPGTGGNTQVGDASGTNSNATSNDDLHITGALETDGAAYIDGSATIAGAATITGATTATGGITSGSNIVSDTDSTDSLGSSSIAWLNLYTDAITTTSGTSLSFAPGATTGDAMDISADSITTGDIFDIEMNAVTTGNVMDIDLSADTINTDVALLNVTGTAINTATNVKLIEMSTTAANDVDVSLIHLERGTNDARIVFDEGANQWQIDQGTGSGLVAIGTGSATSLTDDDADTLVQVEESTDEDIIRFDAGGTEIATIDATSGLIVSSGAVQTGANGSDGSLKIYSEQGATDYSVTLQPHATMTEASTYTLPAADGSTSQVLSTDGNGALSWSTISSDSIGDSDSDTQIQVEESADDDTIRFDTAGTERMTIDSTGTINIDSAATTTDLFNIDSATLTSGNIMDINLSADTLTTDTALFNIAGTAINTATALKLLELSTTAGNDVDVTVAHIERGTDDARIVFDEGSNQWQLDNGDGSGLANITTGSGGVLDATYVTTSANATLTAEVLTTAFTSNLISDADGTRDLGSTTNAWANLYTDAIKTTSGTSLDVDTATIDLSTQAVDVTLEATAADGLNFDSNTLSIDALNNRVGIGTTGPGDTLHVDGAVRIGDYHKWSESTTVVGSLTGMVLQTQETNARALLAFAPNGTSRLSDFWLFNTSDIATDYERMIIGYDGNDDFFHITTDAGGTGTERPLYLGAGGYAVADHQLVLTTGGSVGIGEVAPETLTEWTSTAPYLTLHNSTEENGEGGRESQILFKGEQDGTEETTLAKIQASHDGTADDEKGDLIFYVNDGDDADAPTEAMRINSDGTITFAQALSSYATTELDNLGTVAINTSLISDADGTDDLGSSTVAWANLYTDAIKTTSGTSLDVDTATIDLSTQSVDVTLEASAADGLNFDSNTLSIDALNNRVGIGTASPDSELEVVGALPLITETSYSSTSAGYPSVFRGRRARGTEASPSIVQDGDHLYQYDVRGYDGGDFNSFAGMIRFEVDGTVAANQVPTRIGFWTSESDSTRHESLILEADGEVLMNEGNVGIGETDPETLTEWTSTAPYITLHNSSEENGEGGRESQILFKGEQSGTEETTLAKIQASHDGTADDEKGDLIFYVNDGDDADAPTEAMRINSDGTITFAQALSSYATTELDNLGTVAISESLISDTDNTDDLGSSSKEWKDLYIDGVAYIDAIGESLSSDTDSTDDLGTSSIAWANLYADNILTVSGNNLTLKGAGSSDEIVLQPDNDTDDYLTFAAVSNVPVIYGTGAYVSIGDAATTSQSLDAEDDLLVTGDAEVDGVFYVDGSGDSDFGANVTVDTGNKVILDDDDTEDSYLLHDTTNNWVEVWCDNAEVMHFEADGDVAIAKDKKYILDSDDTSDSYITFASASTRMEFYVDANLSAYLDETGKLYLDLTGDGTSATLFDEYDDIELLKAYVYGRYDELPKEIYNEGFINLHNLKQLISGAIFQMDERLRKVEEQLAQR